MENSKLASSLFAPHFKLSVTMAPNSDHEVEYMTQVPYASVVGSLMYAMVRTWPDIAQAVSMVSRYIANPGKHHWLVVKWIMRYMQDTKDKCLVYQRSGGLISSDTLIQTMSMT